MSTKPKQQPPPDPIHEWDDVPEGYEVVWEEDDRCRAATAEESESRRCRRPGCLRAPVMAMRRSNVARGQNWWLYCDWHTYGRRVEDGIVYTRRLREVRS